MINLSVPNAYWSGLRDQQAKVLRETGVDHFKRSVNRYYFGATIHSFRRHYLPRHLLKSILRGGAAPYGALLASIRGDTGALSRPRLYAAFVGMAWQLARRHDPHGLLRYVEEPLAGDPYLVLYRGRRISQDMATSSQEWNWILSHLPERIIRVAEIGGGYGRLAWMALSYGGLGAYDIYDIEPSLSLSRWYLGETLSRGSWRCSSADAFGTLRYDLAVAVSCFDEMDDAQVHEYCSRITASCTYAYVKAQRRRAPNVTPMSALAIPFRWRVLHEAPCLDHPNFVQRLYLVR